MSEATMASATVVRVTMKDVLKQLGNVPPQRVWMRPYPGTATEKDVLRIRASDEKRLCELIDGVLVEKAMGSQEGLVEMILGYLLLQFVDKHDLGLVLGASGMLRILPNQVRIPDVSFISWDRLPEGKLPPEPIARLAPDLAVEVLSPSNTKKEMERKLNDYFMAGVRLAWLIDPATQTAEVYTSPNEVHRVGKNQALDGGDVLPGFRLPLKQLFARAERRKKKS
jgi:Uma2 family endonuclease